MVELVKADALYKQLANVIRDGIATGRWQPGDMLPSEAAMKTEYGVSATTVRQALIALRAEGLITVRNGIGSFVSNTYNQAATTIDRARTADAPALTPTGEPTTYRQNADDLTAALLGVAENEPLFVVDLAAVEDGTGRKVLIRRTIPIEATDGHAPDPGADTATLIDAQAKRHGKLTTTEYVRARMPRPDEREALDLSDASPIFETVRIQTAKGRTVLAETQRTSAEGIQLAYPIR